MICPYSLRATAQATVSMPLRWDEVKKGLNPENLNLFTATKIEGTPWKGMMGNSQKLVDVENG
jgi:bifunctional non-homologous end joining protein LigD